MKYVDKKWCVYMHTNKINNKKYIGQTVYGDTPNRRWSNGNGYKKNKHFWNAIQKYGWDNFEHEILKSNLSKDEANYWEKYYIKDYNTMDSDIGYNLNSGGDNSIPCEKTRKIMSDIKKESWKKDEYRQKMINARYDFLEKNPNYTSELSKKIKSLYQDPEYKLKIKIARKNGKNASGEDSPIRKPIYCFELDEAFWGAKEAEDKYGILRSSICSCCKRDGHHLSAGTHPTTGEPLHWCYLDEKDTYVIMEHKQHPCSKSIYCPELDESFWGVRDAQDKYGIYNISACLNGKLKSAGKHPVTNKPLHWCYIENKNNFIPPCDDESYMRGVFSNSSKPVYCQELDEYFECISDVNRKYGISCSGITNCCKGKSKSAGKHPTTGENLHWEYVNIVDNGEEYERTGT